MFWHNLIFIWHFSLFQPTDDGSRSMDQYTIRSRSRMIPKSSLILKQTNVCHRNLTWSVAVGHVRRTPNVTKNCYLNEIPRNTFEFIKPGSETAGNTHISLLNWCRGLAWEGELWSCPWRHYDQFFSIKNANVWQPSHLSWQENASVSQWTARVQLLWCYFAPRLLEAIWLQRHFIFFFCSNRKCPLK